MLVVPACLRLQIMYELHTAPKSGHLGFNKTYHKLLERFYWPGVYMDVRTWIGSCSHCNRRKESQHGKVGQMHPLKATEPFYMVGMDLMGTMRPTKNGNKYVLVVTDYLTRWPEAIAIPNKEATTVARAFHDHVVCRHGAPASILTDQGGEFNNHLLTALAKGYGIKKLMATTRKSSTNGLTERFNRTLATMLSMYISARHDDWDVYIPSCLFAYRTSVQETTQVSPFFLLYGRQPKLPVDRALEEKPVELVQAHEFVRRQLGDTSLELHERVLAEARRYVQQMAIAEARANLEARQAKLQLMYAQQAKDLGLEPGSQVYVRMERPEPSKKLRKPFKGPFRVVELLERGNVKLQDEGRPQAPPIVWHITKIKPSRTERRFVERNYYAPPAVPQGAKQIRALASQSDNADPELMTMVQEALREEMPTSRARRMYVPVHGQVAAMSGASEDFWLIPEDNGLHGGADGAAWESFEMACLTMSSDGEASPAPSRSMEPRPEVAAPPSLPPRQAPRPLAPSSSGRLVRPVPQPATLPSQAVREATAPHPAPRLAYSRGFHAARGRSFRGRGFNKTWQRPGYRPGR
jgi:transposase InsO family protein